MKHKMITLLLISLIGSMFVFTGCAEKSNSKESATETETVEEAQVEAEAPAETEDTEEAETATIDISGLEVKTADDGLFEACMTQYALDELGSENDWGTVYTGAPSEDGFILYGTMNYSANWYDNNYTLLPNAGYKFVTDSNTTYNSMELGEVTEDIFMKNVDALCKTSTLIHVDVQNGVVTSVEF